MAGWVASRLCIKKAVHVEYGGHSRCKWKDPTGSSEPLGSTISNPITEAYF
jgi:hypothetical protein